MRTERSDRRFDVVVVALERHVSVIFGTTGRDVSDRRTYTIIVTNESVVFKKAVRYTSLHSRRIKALRKSAKNTIRRGAMNKLSCSTRNGSARQTPRVQFYSNTTRLNRRNYMAKKIKNRYTVVKSTFLKF